MSYAEAASSHRGYRSNVMELQEKPVGYDDSRIQVMVDELYKRTCASSNELGVMYIRTAESDVWSLREAKSMIDIPLKFLQFKYFGILHLLRRLVFFVIFHSRTRILIKIILGITDFLLLLEYRILKVSF